MSGIAGLWYLDGGGVDGREVSRMIDRMAHRGPDGSALWCEGSVGLGHLLLHTTPESLHEKLPLASRDGLAVITADARIDNRDELIGRLCITPPVGVAITDSELILAAYDRWGESCAEELLGDFAFAIWDAGRRKLFCARDHSGVKPFFYSFQEGHLFAFASEIKGLLVLPDIPERLNEVRLGDYLINQARYDKEITTFEGILRLPPASTLVISDECIALRRYWEPTARIPSAILSDDEYAEEFRKIFTEAVRCRLRSAHPVASELSGGLDSSFITCVARDLMREAGQSLNTISLSFENVPECDERSYREPILAEGGIVPHCVPGDTYGPLSVLKEVYKYLDDGFTAGNHHLVWKMLAASREIGARVVLDGIDGDSTVSHGLDYFSELGRAGEWERFAEEARAAQLLMRETPDKHLLHEVLGSPRELLAQYGFNILAEHADRGEGLRLLSALFKIRRHFQVNFFKLFKIYGRRLLSRAVRPSRAVPRLPPLYAHLDEQYARRNGLESRFGGGVTPIPSSVREGQRVILDSDVFARMMEVTDHYAAAHSVEVRHPFMDKRLIEFCLALPPSQSLSKGWTRLVMRNAMKGIVPEAIRTRRGKSNIQPAFDRGIFVLDREILREALAPEGPLQAYLRPESLQKYSELAEGTGQENWMLCMYATLSIWLRTRGFCDVDDSDLDSVSPADSLLSRTVKHQTRVARPLATKL